MGFKIRGPATSTPSAFIIEGRVYKSTKLSDEIYLFLDDSTCGVKHHEERQGITWTIC